MNRNNRMLTIVLIAAIIMTMILPVEASTSKQVTQYFRNIKITVDGKQIDPRDANGKGVEPFIIDGTTYLPVRAVAEAVGMDVDWIGSTNTVVLKSKGTQSATKSEYHIGDTWVVAGQWELAITGVTEMLERNPYSDKTPGAVYCVDYTYKNLGWESDYMDGLFWTLTDTIIDANGIMGYAYPNGVTRYPQAAPIGATCIAQDVIGVDNPGSFKLVLTQYDSNDVKQTATFVVEVE